MYPQLVRSLDLSVDEAVRRLPSGDLGAPLQRDAAPTDAVFDDGPLSHDDGRRQNTEVKPGRRQRVQVAGITEEVEDVADRSRQPEFRP